MSRFAAFAVLTAAAAAWAVGAPAQPQPPTGNAPPPAPAEPASPPLTVEGQGFNGSAPAKCAPDQLFRAVVREVSPGVAAGDRRAQPRTLFRKGAAYFRADDLPDPVRGDQLSVIIAEPDVWNVNFATRQAQHRADPGPSFDVHAPVLPMLPGTPPLFMTLEYGCEAAFVAAHAPQPQRTVAWGAAAASVHVVTVGDRSVAILMDDRRQAPLIISYLRAGAPVFVVRYDDYRQDAPERPGLFAPPKWTEEKGDSQAIPLPKAAPGDTIIPLPRQGGERPVRPRGGGGKRRQMATD